MTKVVVCREGDLRFIGIDRPEKQNALDDELVRELHGVLDDDVEPLITVFHSTTPGMFVSGADIAALRRRTASDAARRINGRLFDRIAHLRWPTIAAVDGAAFGGGCELALACDFRVASDRARFAQPETLLGIIAAAGANHRLERLVGLSVARRMLLAGEVLDVTAAHAAGLVDVVAGDEDLDGAVRALAGQIARGSWQALEMTKVALAAAENSTAGLDVTAQSLLFDSPEKARRMDEFLQGGKKGESHDDRG